MTKNNNEGIWVIGDVHGEYDKLIKLVQELPQDADICFVGDLIDRGDESAQVIEFVMKNNYQCVLGNHEQMMLEDYYDAKHDWRISYGSETIDSYKHFSKQTYKTHIEWMKQLPYFLCFEIDGHKPLVVSHSYIHHIWQHQNYMYELEEVEDVLWRHMHEKALFNSKLEEENNIFNIFGHSPIKKPYATDILAMIDTGATYKNREGFGKLTALHYPSLEIVSI